MRNPTLEAPSDNSHCLCCPDCGSRMVSRVLTVQWHWVCAAFVCDFGAFCKRPSSDLDRLERANPGIELEKWRDHD